MSINNPSGAAMVSVGVKLGGGPPKLHQPDIPINTEQEKLNAERIFGRQLRLNTGYVGAAVQPVYGFAAFEPVMSGRVQEVLSISISGADPFTAVAGQVVGFISTYKPQDSATEPAFPNLVIPLSNLPLIYAPSRRQIFLNANERLILAFKGLPNNTQLQASINVVEYELSSFLSQLVP